MKKRYQYLTKDGVKWTDWFKVEKKGDKIQLNLKNGVLKNEYKEESD